MINLDDADRDMVLHHLTVRQVYAKAEEVAVNGTGRAVLAYLLRTAVNLAAMSCQLGQAYAEDSVDITAATQPGLGLDRPSVLAAASTCAHNAALFLQEAQRRRAIRSSGHDPLITPQPA